MTTNGANGVLKRSVTDSNAPLKRPKLSSESEQDEAHVSTSNGHADDAYANHVSEQQHNGLNGGNNNDAEASNSSALDAKKHKKKKHKKEKKRKKDKHGDGGGDDESASRDKIKKKHKKEKKHKKHKKKHKSKHGDADGDDDASSKTLNDSSNAGATVKSETPDELSRNLRDGGSSSLSPSKVDAPPLRTKREIVDDDDAKETFDDDDATDDEDYGGSSSKNNKKSSSKKASSKKPSSLKKPPAASTSKSGKSQKASTQPENVSPAQSKRAVKKEKEEAEQAQVWRWWEDQVGGKEDSTVKWSFLEHKGPVFAPPYEPLPANVRFLYDGKHMKLSNEAEEVATFYARMLDHEYTSKDVFNKNFFKDWRKVMTTSEREAIKDLSKCNFSEMHTYFKEKSEERKAMSKEEKNKLKEENARLQAEYGFCKLDGYQQKIANFRIEPPGLFRGRGDHPKMGMLKKRVQPEGVIINCSKDAQVPKPPAGHKWQQVRHDNTVTWLCSWQDNIMSSSKYMMLNPSSKLKGQKDLQKYEKARQLHKKIDKIRETYRHDWKAKEMEIRQRATALYLIDKLALRAGNEKEEGEAADTVGCCSLRVEHIRLEEKPAAAASSGGDGDEQKEQFVVHFDFLGKDSIPYQNTVEIEKRVYKNLALFCENKKPGDDLFDRLDTAKLNKHLNSLMDGLTAKVFRTYNASITLQQELRRNTTAADDTVAKKLLAYNRANRSVAILCNHQRSVPKSFGKSMEGLQAKIDAKKQQVKDVKKEFDAVKKEVKGSKNPSDKKKLENKQRQYERTKEQLEKLELQATDREENKSIALGTSKLNYLDPRISVAWCKKFGVPIEKIYNKTQRDKFQWAIDMTDANFEF